MIADRAQVDLLLRLLEARELAYTSSALVDYFGPPGQALVDAGLLVPAGFDRTVIDEAGDVFEVDTGAVGGLGYHSPYRGWVAVHKAQLQRYQPDLSAILRMLLGDELTELLRGPLELETGLCWHVGGMRLHQTGLTDVLFARRLDERDSWENVRSALDRRPSAKLRLLLTSTRRLPAAALPMTKLVPIGDVLSSSEPSRIDSGILRARFAGRVYEPADGPLHLSEDGRTLTINGSTLITFKSDGQIKVMHDLVDAYRRGKRLNAADTLKKAGLASRTFKQAFGEKWKDLSPYLKSKDQLWGFEV